MQGVVRLNVIDQYLQLQSQPTAVERFSERHDAGLPEGELYRDLIPLSRPREGQQYAFEVDLDACTGCKACVTACHRLNGLDRQEAETWRSVGLLHGGTPEAPLQQTVTTACHHCLDPACMKGCPVNAYEKDPTTGIVKHLDDQCIGCQYCTLTCPYEVPQYSNKRGIVRKCDMCSDRLAIGEAPACVQACPNEAIRIRTIDLKSALEEAQTDAFLPGAPPSNITVPTTRYVSKRPLPRNMLPADFYAVRDSKQHWPLAVMLVLMQLSVGIFLLDALLGAVGVAGYAGKLRTLQAALGALFAHAALGAGTFHLGRPLYAFRAVIGFKRSWFSREVVAFALYALLATGQAALMLALEYGPPAMVPAALAGLAARGSSVVAFVGLLGVVCSVMLYHVTGRQWWSMSRTGFRFFGTTIVLGASGTFATVAVLHAASVRAPELGSAAVATLSLLVITKIAGELSVLINLSDKRLGELKRTALLLVGPLSKMAGARAGLALLGGVALPLLSAAVSIGWGAGWAVLGFASMLASEVLERALYYRAVSNPRMPGTVAQ